MPRATTSDERLVEELRAHALPLHGGEDDYDALLDLIGDARVVMLGEASHGTREFYTERAEITLRLIEELGFDAVAIEADWVPTRRVHRHVTGADGDDGAEASLAEFTQFPLWMWRNAEFARFVGALRDHNAGVPQDERVGVYGLDMYREDLSADAVVAYLESVDPVAAEEARERYGCVVDADGAAADTRPLRDRARACVKHARHQLNDLVRAMRQIGGLPGDLAVDAAFDAVQNARVVLSAQLYGASSHKWNVRDRHMMQTLVALAEHLDRRPGDSRIVIWAHNSHVGDARATEFGRHGQLTLGELVRRRYGDEAVAVGFTTYAGTVLAASDWGEDAAVHEIRPALEGSYESVFHQVAASGPVNFMLILRDGPVAGLLAGERLQRAIGVVYSPGTERVSHYFDAEMSRQFDVVLHFDETNAVRALGPPPETSDALGDALTGTGHYRVEIGGVMSYTVGGVWESTAEDRASCTMNDDGQLTIVGRRTFAGARHGTLTLVVDDVPPDSASTSAFMLSVRLPGGTGLTIDPAGLRNQPTGAGTARIVRGEDHVTVVLEATAPGSSESGPAPRVTGTIECRLRSEH